MNYIRQGQQTLMSFASRMWLDRQRHLRIGVCAFALGSFLPMAYLAYWLGSDPDLAKEDPRTVSKISSKFQSIIQQLILIIWLLVWRLLYYLDRPWNQYDFQLSSRAVLLC